jgi:PAS domain S-box-containing protein
VSAPTSEPEGRATTADDGAWSSFLSRLLDQAAQPFGIADLEGRLVRTNRAVEELLGYAAEELRGKTLREITPERYWEKTNTVLHELRRTGKAQRYVKAYIHKDGHEVPVELLTDLYLDPRGTPIGFYAFITDLTERQRAEQALRESEEGYRRLSAALAASERQARALFEGIEDAVFVHDRDGRILDANPAACRRLGYTRAEFLRLTTHDIDDPEFDAGYTDRLETQLREGHLRIEGRHRTRDGRVVPVDINTSTIQLWDQPAVLAVIRDITERKALEETRRHFAEAQLQNAWAIEAKNRALTQSEARYRQLTEGCLDAIVVADQAGRITLFNPAAERTFGYKAAEVIGRPFVELMPTDLRGDLITGLQDYVHERVGQLVGRTLEMRGRRQDGEVFPLEVSLSAIETAGELQFLAAIRDLGERQRMRAMLMQSEKLASIGLLSAGLAHEINNPLAYIANNLAVLERDLKGIMAMMAAYETAHDQLETAAPAVLARVGQLGDDLDWPYVRDNLGRLLSRTRDGVQRVANIVQNLRGLARTAPPRLEPVQLHDLIDGALEMVQGRFRHAGIDVDVDRAVLPKIACVPSQIGQVLLNLLVNAVQAIEEANRPDGNRIRVSVREADGHQEIAITDNGCGIPASALPRLFDPFFTTKAVGEGTGLGLAISHGIVSGHGGRIEVESEPGRGSTFRVFLPANASAGALVASLMVG